MKLPNWIKNAYKSTDVPWSRSQSEIYKMLNSLGIYQIRFTNLQDRFALEFLMQVRENEKPRAVRLISPLQYTGDDEKLRTKELNRTHRMLLAHLKAKFLAVGLGLTEFEEEFMAHLLITDKHGNSSTVGESFLPKYKKAIDDGDLPEIKLLN